MRVSICNVLDAIDELGLANPELVAWELSLLERDRDPTWQAIEAQSYVRRAQVDPITKQRMYRLARRTPRQLSHCPTGQAQPQPKRPPATLLLPQPHGFEGLS